MTRAQIRRLESQMEAWMVLEAGLEPRKGTDLVLSECPCTQQASKPLICMVIGWSPFLDVSAFLPYLMIIGHQLLPK